MTIDVKHLSVKPLTEEGQLETQVDWSLESQHLSFLFNHPGDFEILTIRKDGTHAEQLTSNTYYDAEPVLSPYMDRIACISRRGQHSQLIN